MAPVAHKATYSDTNTLKQVTRIDDFDSQLDGRAKPALKF